MVANINKGKCTVEAGVVNTAFEARRALALLMTNRNVAVGQISPGLLASSAKSVFDNFSSISRSGV
jgi:hypothetical protein